MADNTILTKIKSYFTAASTRENLTSGEELQTSLGKVKKWFSDLGTAAFTNSSDYAAASHNQPSSTITAMTGYTKPQATSAIAATDTLNEAIGKLEKAIDEAGGGLQPGNVDVSTNSVTLTSSSPTATVTLSNATGAVGVICSAENFKATLSGNTITINRTGIYDEEGFVLVTVASDSTHSSNIIAISVHSSGVILCTWSGGSDEAVASMIQAAHNGDIDLTDYWSVGDTRTVNEVTYILRSGISYRDTTSTTKTSTFKVTYDLGNNNSISFNHKSKRKYTTMSQYTIYYIRYTSAPSNSYLNNYRLSFYVKQNDIDTTNYTKTTIDYNVKGWYGSTTDLLDYRIYDVSYICGRDGEYDPVANSVGTNSTGIANVTIMSCNGWSGNVSTTTTGGTAANPSVVSNIGIIGYFLI